LKVVKLGTWCDNLIRAVLEKVKQNDEKAKTKRRETNLERVGECQRQDSKKYKQANPEKVKLIYKGNRARLQNIMDNPQNGINVEDNSEQSRNRTKELEVKSQFHQDTAAPKLVSYADALWARHAIFLSDEPKERLR